MELEDFLELIDRSDVDPQDWPDLPEDPAVTGGDLEEEDESKSVARFKSLENLPPSLSSLCIFKTSSWINEMTCDPSNNKQVHDMFHNRVKMLPVDVQAKIRTQLSMTALRCIYQHHVWELEPHIIAAGIKQEEDMLRYLFWKQPNNPLLRHFEKTVVIDLFEDKKSIDLIHNTKLPPTETVKEALVQSYLTSCFDFKYFGKQQFMQNFENMTNGCLKKLDWRNVLVVGGSVLKSLRQEINSVSTGPYYRDGSDIDIYLYGLTTKEAQAKVKQIFNSVQSCWREKIGIFKTANTITLVSSASFRNIQIILSTYASPLEILLASDMNSCSIGFNGDSVLVIPRFLFGSIYGSNFLDSSTKFGTKLRWERITKYYKRGYNIAAPLYVRVHGHGSFNTIERITPRVHPSTNQMIELMCLMKMVLMRMSHGKENFGIARETTFDDWPRRWISGMHIAGRVQVEGSYGPSDYQNLCQKLPNPPAWVTRYFNSRQSLIRPQIREAPRYSEEQRTIEFLHIGDQHNYNPANGVAKLHDYIADHCKFDNYNDSSLQCFHLNFFVDKEQTVVNPYKEMNTSLAALSYRVETLPIVFNNFNDFLKGKVQTTTQTFKLHNYTWKLTLSWGSKDISFITLTKESDEEDSFKYSQYRPTKFFANFCIRIKNQHKNSAKGEPRDLIFDGSQVFGYDEPDNMWLTWAYNQYYQGYIPNYNYNTDDELLPDVQYVEKGNTHWEVVMQLIEPQFSMTTV